MKKMSNIAVLVISGLVTLQASALPKALPASRDTNVVDRSEKLKEAKKTDVISGHQFMKAANDSSKSVTNSSMEGYVKSIGLPYNGKISGILSKSFSTAEFGMIGLADAINNINANVINNGLANAEQKDGIEWTIKAALNGSENAQRQIIQLGEYGLSSTFTLAQLTNHMNYIVEKKRTVADGIEAYKNDEEIANCKL